MPRMWHAGKLVIVTTPTTTRAGLQPPERLARIERMAAGGYPVVEGRVYFKNGREKAPRDPEIRLSIRPVRSKAEAQEIALRWQAHQAMWGIRRFFSQVGAEAQMSDDDLITIYTLIQKYEARCG